MLRTIIVAMVAGCIGAVIGVSSVQAVPQAIRLGYVTVPEVI